MNLPTVAARLKDSGDLLLAGSISERLPMITNGLVAHYPFDGTLNHFQKVGAAKVGGFRRVQDGSSKWYTWFSSNAGSFTDIPSITSLTVAEAKQYNLIVADGAYGSLSPAEIDALKSFVDAGVSCVGTGNDTQTNVFVKTYDSSGAKIDHNLIIEDGLPFTVPSGTYAGGGTDLNGGITELQNDAYTFYKRADIDRITGYIYDSPTGGTFVYDQEWANVQALHVAAFEYALGRSNANIINTNNTLTDNYIAVDRAVTNMLSTGAGSWTDCDFENPSLYASDANWSRRIVQDPDATNGVCLEIEALTDKTTWESALYLSNPLPFTDNSTKFTFSMRYRVLRQEDNPSGANARNQLGIWSHWRRGNGLSSIPADYVFSTNTVLVPQDWQVYTVTQTSPAADTAGKHFALGTGAVKAGTKYRIDWVQFEKTPFPTSFINGIRGNGNFYLSTPTMKSKTSWTVHLEYKHPDMTSSGGNIVFLSSYDPALGSNGEWFGTKGNSNNLDYFSGASIPEVWNKATFVYNGVDTKLYMDGVYRSTYSGKFFFGNDFLKFAYSHGAQYIGACSYKDLSIYSRALSEDEIKKLTGKPFDIRESGDMIVKGLTEKPVGIPSDATWIPLDFNAQDRDGILAPSAEANIVYNDGVAWVGRGVQNLFTHSNTGTFSVTSGKAFQVLEYENNSVVYRYDFSGESYAYKGRDIAVAAGTAYFASLDIFVSEDYNGAQTFMANLEQTGGGGFVYDMTQKGTWQTFTRSFTPSAAGNTRFLMYPSNNNTTATTGYVLYRNAQFIASTYQQPFINGTRGASDLEFNLNRDYGLSWAGDWSIVYWKKPLNSSTGNPINFNLESLGSNSNSVGSGYFYWGKDNTGYTIVGATPSSSPELIYHGNWRMISLTKTGTTLTVKEWASDGTVHVRTVATTNTVANYYVCQHGYDFKMNGWDNSNVSDNYYKDLIIAKRAFTDAELLTLYKTPMRAYQDRVQIQNNIKDNQTLV